MNILLVLFTDENGVIVSADIMDYISSTESDDEELSRSLPHLKMVARIVILEGTGNGRRSLDFDRSSRGNAKTEDD